MLVRLQQKMLEDLEDAFPVARFVGPDVVKTHVQDNKLVVELVIKKDVELVQKIAMWVTKWMSDKKYQDYHIVVGVDHIADTIKALVIRPSAEWNF